MSNILVLPCSMYQESLIRFLKKENNVIGVNPVSNEISDLTDFLIKKNIFDIEEILEEISKLPKKYKKIDQIFTDQSDVAVLPSIELAKKLNIKHNSKKSAMKFSCDKAVMYENLKKNGFKCLDFQIVKSVKEIKLKLPFIIKPSDSANSRGVMLVKSKKEIEKAFEISLSFSRNKKLIIQKWSDSKFQITCEGICIAGKHKTIASSYKGPYLSTAVTSFVRWPLQDKLSQSKINEIYETNDKIVESTKIDCCLTHAEYIIENEEVYLNEIACRGGGFKISSHITPWVSGIDCYQYLYDYKMKGIINEIPNPSFKSAIIKFFTDSPKKEMIKDKGIMEFKDNFVSGQYVKNDFNPRKGYLLAKEENSKLLDELLEKVQSCF